MLTAEEGVETFKVVLLPQLRALARDDADHDEDGDRIVVAEQKGLEGLQPVGECASEDFVEDAARRLGAEEVEAAGTGTRGRFVEKNKLEIS